MCEQLGRKRLLRSKVERSSVVAHQGVGAGSLGQSKLPVRRGRRHDISPQCLAGLDRGEPHPPSGAQHQEIFAGAQLGAKLVIQRAVEDEFDAWLGRARYEREPAAAPGKRNGFRPRRLQSAEGEIRVEIPQVREAALPFVSKLFPRGERFLRTEPLKAMVIGAFVRGLSMRDVESLCEEAGLGQVSKSTASRICRELRERFTAFMARDLTEVKLVALFLDAIWLPVRPSGAKEGVLCAW